MPIEGVTVTKIIEPQQLGVHNDKIVYIFSLLVVLVAERLEAILITLII